MTLIRMPPNSPPMRRALEYVRNTNGGATLAHFARDHAPIGHDLWACLRAHRLATLDNLRVVLTDLGRAELAKAEGDG